MIVRRVQASTKSTPVGGESPLVPPPLPRVSSPSLLTLLVLVPLLLLLLLLLGEDAAVWVRAVTRSELEGPQVQAPTRALGISAVAKRHR